MKSLKLLMLSLFISSFFTPSFAQEKQEEKIIGSTRVLKEFIQMKEKIPAKLFEISQGIIIIPKMINAGLGIAGKRGKGIAMVRLSDTTWSNPVFVTLTGGSVGFQAGVQSVDLVLIFKQKETLEKIGGGSFTLGGDISVTAGPVGRNSTASTDYKLEAEVYSYSRSKGLFAGISLSGSALDIDEKANDAFYDEDTDTKTLLSDDSKSNTPNIIALKLALNNLYR